MQEVAMLIDRNKRIAAKRSESGALESSLPEALLRVKGIIIGCADMRVDPAHVLGLEPEEAVVMRNIGGRVTPGLLAQLGMLGRIGQAEGKTPGGGGEFNLIVLQHTDCGITRLADDTAMLREYFQVGDAALASKAVLDPRAAVAADVAALRAVPGLPGDWLLSGMVYDVRTGLIDLVEQPRPIAGAQHQEL